jgi:DNA-binding beta-propeller fold protein YncE
LADDLDRFLNGQPIHARPTGVIEKAAKWCRRRPAIAGMLAFIVLLATASLVTVTTLWQRAEAAKDSEGSARADERTQRERAEMRSGELLVANARYAWLTDDVDAARKALNECPIAFRNADWLALDRACSAGRQIALPTGIPVEAIAYDATGRLLAVGANGGLIQVWAVATGKETATARLLNHSILSVAFTSDGKVVLAANSHSTPGGKLREFSDLMVFDPVSGRAARAWERPDRQLRFAVSPDGKRVISASNSSNVAVVFDAVSGMELYRLESKGIVTRVSFSPDGRYIATGALPAELKIWDAETGAFARQIQCPANFFGVNSIAVRQDGARVAVSGRLTPRGEDLIVLDPTQEVRRIPTPYSQVGGVIYSPDGRWLAAFGSSDSAIRVWDAQSGGKEITFRGYPSTVRAIAFRPDSRQLAASYRDGRVVVWTIEP